MTLNFKHLALGALGAMALIPAAASAQSYGYPNAWRQAPDSYSDYRSYRDGRSDRLADRTERLRDWIRQGSEQGWLRGWRAQRAWRELRDIRQMSERGYDRGEAWQRLERLTDFVRDARRDAY